MAGRVPQPRIYGNFKPSKGKQAKAKKTRVRAAERRDGMSAKHLAAIRKCPCIGCLKIPAGTVHHLKATGERGLALRSPDKFGVPLCFGCHDAIERAGAKNEISTFEAWGVPDVLQLASDLWRVSPEAPRMTKVVIAHKGLDYGHDSKRNAMQD